MPGPELDEILRRAIDDRLLDVHTSTLGKVETVNDDGTIDVRLLANRPVPSIDGGYLYEAPPVIPGAVLLAFGTARSFFQVTVQPGDFVWLIFSENSLDEALANESVSNPQVVTRHSYSHALAIPIVLPGKASGSDLVALAGKVDADIEALTDWCAQHTHTSAAPGSPTSPPAIAPPTPEETGSAEVEVR